MWLQVELVLNNWEAAKEAVQSLPPPSTRAFPLPSQHAVPASLITPALHTSELYRYTTPPPPPPPPAPVSVQLLAHPEHLSVAVHQQNIVSTTHQQNIVNTANQKEVSEQLAGLAWRSSVSADFHGAGCRHMAPSHRDGGSLALRIS